MDARNAIPNNKNEGSNLNNNDGNNYNYFNSENENYNVKFQRLSNQPFNYNLKVNSDKSTEAVVRIFIGPKYDSNGQLFTLPHASQYFVQLDLFRVQRKYSDVILFYVFLKPLTPPLVYTYILEPNLILLHLVFVANIDEIAADEYG